jgi:hypothetical protein
VIGNQSKSNDIIDEFGSAPASGAGIRKTVVVSTHVDTWDRKEPEQFSV